MTPIVLKSILDPIYISDVQLNISDVRYLYRTSDIQYPTLAGARTRARAKAKDRAWTRARAGISDIGYRYRTMDIDIGRRI